MNFISKNRIADLTENDIDKIRKELEPRSLPKKKLEKAIKDSIKKNQEALKLLADR